MFSGAKAFNQDLSSLAVPNIRTKPYEFDFGATSWLPADKKRPCWGCFPTVRLKPSWQQALAASGWPEPRFRRFVAGSCDRSARIPGPNATRFMYVPGQTVDFTSLAIQYSLKFSPRTPAQYFVYGDTGEMFYAPSRDDLDNDGTGNCSLAESARHE